jgi:5-methylcytosine-specific restriction endonuclease McrA
VKAPRISSDIMDKYQSRLSFILSEMSHRNIQFPEITYGEENDDKHMLETLVDYLREAGYVTQQPFYNISDKMMPFSEQEISELLEMEAASGMAILSRSYREMYDDYVFCADSGMEVKKKDAHGWRYYDVLANIVSTSSAEFTRMYPLLTGFDSPSELSALVPVILDESRLKRKKYYNIDTMKEVQLKTVQSNNLCHDDTIMICTSDARKLVPVWSIFRLHPREGYLNVTPDYEEYDETEPLRPPPPKKTTTTTRKGGSSSRKAIPIGVRNAVWNKYNGRSMDGKCYVCEKSISFESWHASHIISDADGGLPTVDNLVPCCPPCNLGMGKTDLTSYIRKHYPRHKHLKSR